MSVFRVEFLPADVPGPGGGEIAHLVMDDPARRVNVLDEQALGDLDAALGQLEGTAGPGGLVVRSGKPGIVRGRRRRGGARRAHGPGTGAGPGPARAGGLRAPGGAALPDGRGHRRGLPGRRAPSWRWPAARASPRRSRTRRSGCPRSCSASSRPSADHAPAAGWWGSRPRWTSSSRVAPSDARSAERAGLVERAVPGAWLDRARAPASGRTGGTGGPRSGGGARSARRDRWRPRGLRSWFVDGTPFGRGLTFARARALTKARTGGRLPRAGRRAQRPAPRLRPAPRGLAADRGRVGRATWSSGRCARTWCAPSGSRSARARSRCPGWRRRSPSSGSRSWAPGRWAQASPNSPAGTGSRCGCATPTRPRWRVRCAAVRARVAERSGAARGRAARDRGAARAHLPQPGPGRPEARGSRDRGGGRGPGRQAPGVRRARGPHAARRGAGDQHLLALGGRAGRGARAPAALRRDALLPIRSTAGRWSRWCAARRPRQRRWPRPSRWRGGWAGSRSW